MSSDPGLLDTMRSAYAAYDTGDAGPLLALFSEEGVIRFTAPESFLHFAGPSYGPEGARNALIAISEMFEWKTYNVYELVVDGNSVFAITGGLLRHKESDQETEVQLGDLIRFEGGKIVEFIEFFDSAGLRAWMNRAGTPSCAELRVGEAASAAGISPLNQTAAEALDQPSTRATENKALLSRCYDAYARCDPAPLASLFDGDASYNTVARCEDFAFAGPCYGRGNVLDNIARIHADYDLEKYEINRMIAQDDLVAVHADVGFRYKSTGNLVAVDKVDLFRMRDGKIIEFNEFFDTASAYDTREGA
ncbi:nuclear transport factor 2 family protein [Pelagibius sp. Alg239-R121]|uniref:nuclear transport factor 2 family protein n=1 Tax=Pelagibius sp. Alg239-R121 TaxID=2993448 RepID=UPI0024A6655B|nr:nuclear transport factor 2 family protein [Pelagibius sp. Alg239-R121]